MAITLKAARVNAGFTQEEAAKRLNVSRDTVRSWEMGKTYPKTNNIQMIEKLYDIAYADIIFLPKGTA